MVALLPPGVHDFAVALSFDFRPTFNLDFSLSFDPEAALVAGFLPDFAAAAAVAVAEAEAVADPEAAAQDGFLEPEVLA